MAQVESFNGLHKKKGDRFLQEKRGDRSPTQLDILNIFHSQLVTKRRHCYLRKTYLWLSAVLLEMSLSQKSRKLAIKPRRRSPLSKNRKVDSLREAVRYPPPPSSPPQAETLGEKVRLHVG